MTKRVIGYHIADNHGRTLHGDVESDCRDLAPFDVLSAAAAAEFLSMHPDCGYVLLPIYGGDIERPEIVSWWPRLQQGRAA